MTGYNPAGNENKVREMKFRGKCVETGKWIYGMLSETVCGGNYHRYIKPIEEKAVRVDCKTIGQYTGMKTKGLFCEVYEGDTGYIDAGYRGGANFEVKFIDGGFVYVSTSEITKGQVFHGLNIKLEGWTVEVKGNIHE